MKEYNNVFLAIPEAVVSRKEIAFYNDIYNLELSEPLGYFLVKPIRRLRFFRDTGSFGMRIVGFYEIRTGQKIITRTFQRGNLGEEEILQHDVLATTVPKAGDVYWKVDDFRPASTILQELDFRNYFSLSKDEIRRRLRNIHSEAMQIATNGREKAKQLIR